MPWGLDPSPAEFADPNALPRQIKQRVTVKLPPGLPVPSMITDTGASIAIARHA